MLPLETLLVGNPCCREGWSKTVRRMLRSAATPDWPYGPTMAAIVLVTERQLDLPTDLGSLDEQLRGAVEQEANALGYEGAKRMAIGLGHGFGLGGAWGPPPETFYFSLAGALLWKRDEVLAFLGDWRDTGRVRGVDWITTGFPEPPLYRLTAGNAAEFRRMVRI